MTKKTGVTVRRTVYSTFRGADFSGDPSLVDKSRSPLCTNIVSDAAGMPEKRPGWRTLHQFDAPVYGLFCGLLSAGERRLCHAGDRLYAWDGTGAAPAQLLAGLPTRRSRGLCLDGKLWIVTGAGYYVSDGERAGRVTAQSPYVPTTTITREPAGGGATFESVNLLTPYRKNAFQTDGTARDFTLDAEVDEGGDVTVWVWGQEMTAGTDYTVDRANGVITMTTAPAAPAAGSADGLVVQFPHTVSGYADRVDKCTLITAYGLGADDRAVLSGNPDFPNVDWLSAPGDPSYIPDLSYSLVGGAGGAICGYGRSGADQWIVKQETCGGESTVFLRSAALNDGGEAVFTLKQAASGVGAVAPGSFASLLDEPLFLTSGGICTLSVNDLTGTRAVRNRSRFLNGRLTREPGLAAAEAVSWNGLYLLAVGSGRVYVLDGRQGRCYRPGGEGDYDYEGGYWEHVPADCWLCRRGEQGDELYFGTAGGGLCRFNTDMATVARFADDDAAVCAVWATRYDDDGSPALLKTLLKRGCCVTIKPYSRSSATVYFRSDRSDGREVCAASDSMDTFVWDDIDFERFTFATDDSPREIFFGRRIKNYKRLQIVVRNDQPREGFGVYQIAKHYVQGGFARR